MDVGPLEAYEEDKGGAGPSPRGDHPTQETPAAIGALGALIYAETPGRKSADGYPRGGCLADPVLRAGSPGRGHEDA